MGAVEIPKEKTENKQKSLLVAIIAQNRVKCNFTIEQQREWLASLNKTIPTIMLGENPLCADYCLTPRMIEEAGNLLGVVDRTALTVAQLLAATNIEKALNTQSASDLVRTYCILDEYSNLLAQPYNDKINAKKEYIYTVLGKTDLSEFADTITAEDTETESKRKQTERAVRYFAIKRALSILLSHTGTTTVENVGLAKTRTTYSIEPRKDMPIYIPVLMKYLEQTDMKDCIEEAQRIALARKVRGYFFWTFITGFLSFFLGYAFWGGWLAVAIIFGCCQAFILTVFLRRWYIGRHWRRSADNLINKTEAFEKMIEDCRKDLRFCPKGLLRHMIGE